MNWKCPEDWKHIPDPNPASANMMFCIMFNGENRWQQHRSRTFRRCSASGKLIFPWQKAWRGIVAIKEGGDYDNFGRKGKGSYTVAWLNNDQYLIQKLKGNI